MEQRSRIVKSIFVDHCTTCLICFQTSSVLFCFAIAASSTMRRYRSNPLQLKPGAQLITPINMFDCYPGMHLSAFLKINTMHFSNIHRKFDDIMS